MKVLKSKGSCKDLGKLAEDSAKIYHMCRKYRDTLLIAEVDSELSSFVSTSY